MLKKIAFFAYHFIFWIVYFITIKFIFLFYHHSSSFQLSISDWIQIIKHGLIMDISTAGYLMTIPCLFFILLGWTGHNTITKTMKFYTFFFIVFCSILAVIDMDIYSFWGYHLDVTPLTYLKNTKEAFASISIWHIVLQLFIIALLIFSFIWFYIKSIPVIIDKMERTKWYTPIVFCFIAPLLLLSIRGSLGIAPMNVGRVYFHRNQFANQAAVNYLWNCGNSLINLGSLANPYITMEQDKAEEMIRSLYKHAPSTSKILNTTKPNVLLIILESFTAKAIEPLGGLPNVTPCLNNLIHEGVLFSNLYASGERSEKAMVAIFSAFPAQPQKSIIIYPSKTMHLPSISNDMKKEGYNLSFYYGGNIDFASMRSYFNMIGFTNIISEDDFSKEMRNSKWGVHDHFVFDRLQNDLSIAQQPFFYSYFTLSSHEPFEVPARNVFEGNEVVTKFKNALHYTDSALGNFIDKAKKTNWWKNTLVVIVADHGIQTIDNVTNYSLERNHIPMLWLGGALAVKDTVIPQACSQTDLAATMLAQLKMPHANFPYSKDIFNTTQLPFALYVFNNGFGYVTDSSHLIFDCNSNQTIQCSNKDSLQNATLGRAYLQVLYNDFLKK